MCCHHLNRRDFLGLTSGMIAAAGAATARERPRAQRAPWAADLWKPDRPFRAVGSALRVQPVLMYRVAERREATSWKSWGGVQTDDAASKEAARIAKELDALADDATFPLKVLPVVKVKTADEAARLRGGDFDLVLLYPATGSGRVLEACCAAAPNTLIFVRHRSGPIYYWYEALSVKYLGTDEKELPQKRVSVHDVVVDDYRELLWRLRAVYAVKNFTGTRIVALGGAWGKYAPQAPDVARDKHAIDIVEVDYDDVAPRIGEALADNDRVARAEAWTDQYLALPDTVLATDRQFVVNAFLLYGVFKDLMREHDAAAFTIRKCMSTIMPMAKTTACLTLSLLNDEGVPTFCESDFVIIPAGILLYHLSGKPVFLHNSTFPHQGIVTCAHCTGPRRMNGVRYEPTLVTTHFESEYGAAPKVDMPVGQQLTFLDPEYSTGRWVGFTGVVVGNPAYDICRSQQDVAIQGDWTRLIKEVRDSHWVAAYGNCLKEAQYAARKIGIRWEGIVDIS
jgi:hypothetical protein